MNIINGGSINQSNRQKVNSGFVHPSGWFDIKLRLSDSRIISASNSQNLTIKDSNISRTTGSLIARDWFVDASLYPRKDTPVLNYSISSGGNLIQDTLNPTLFKSQVVNGYEAITVSSEQRILNLPVNSIIYSDSSTVDTFVSFLTNSLAKNCSDNIDNRLAGKNRNLTIDIYNSDNSQKEAGNYNRNPNLWCNDLVSQLTCIIPWISTRQYLYGATPITKRHIIFPCHIAFSDGSIYDFVNTDNTVIRRTQIKSKLSPSYNSSTNAYDFAVGLLDSPLPDWVYIPKLLPSNWRNYLPNIQHRIPVFNTHQYEIASIRDWTSVNSGFAQFSIPANSKRNEFYQSVDNGDSGNPIFLIINNQIVLLSSWTTGGVGSGINYADFIFNINQLISDVDSLAGINTAYQISTIDLSSFPAY